MKDALGREVKVGDRVAFVAGDNDLAFGEVTRAEDACGWVAVLNDSGCCEVPWPRDVLVLPEGFEVRT